ncbi:MAG: glutamate-5-semialdehyde dehydrogenase [Oscillospiraceae bacterium]|nr:glutamate-5-semialdehyde dehydrogenase [Oscillospiraceae bacterium]
MSYIQDLGIRAKAAESAIRSITAEQKNNALAAVAKMLTENAALIIAENKKDLENAEKNGKTKAFIDRLALTEARIKGISDSVMEIAALSDPIGEVLGGCEARDGFTIVKKRVPLGVIGVIYESRPNVTVDAAALCLKSGNVCILRGGSDAIHSSKCLAAFMRKALESSAIPADAVLLVEDTSREMAAEMMKLSGYIDVLIPRGGAGLIRSVVENSTVPVIQTGEGICHLYVDESACLEMALNIADNAKTQRPSVCNSIETVIVHEKLADEFFMRLAALWGDKVEIRHGDYDVEFLDYIISAKTVKNIDEAIAHINKYGTRHSECIVTQDYNNAHKFQQEVDAAAVYVNVSTRFSDGNVFGLGAEIGISNQKLHARGPLGLRELTSYKYLISGSGQIRG